MSQNKTDKKMKKLNNMSLILFLSSTLFFFIVMFQATSALNVCGIGATLPSNPYTWSMPSAYLFNNTDLTTDINTACWTPGQPWDPITIVYKPFPNQCTSSYNAICTEDSENYSSSRTYFTSNNSKRYCVNTDSVNWRWIISVGGLKEIQKNYTQICSGGANSVDTGCNATMFFSRLRNGAVNYSSWNYTGTTFLVNKDVAAFNPICYGGISGTVKDSSNTLLSGVNVTILISGPGVEKVFNSTLTNGLGKYSFASVPATYYRILFSKLTYNNLVVSSKVNYTNTSTVDAVLTSGICNADCTTQVDPSRCSASCNGIGGCNFYNTTVATLLDGAVVNTNKLIQMAGANYTINTCEGTPTPYVAASLQSTFVSCPLGKSLIVLERVVLKDGQPIKVVIPVCRNS